MTEVDTFLEGAQAVLAALSDAKVAQAWEKASVLEGQTVGGLAGHLARSSVWAVDDYLKAGEPDAPLTFDSAGAYYAGIVERATEADHAAVRQRSAQVGEAGPEAVVAEMRERIKDLEPRLAAAGADRPVAVIGGAVMRLGDYLQTRIVEQVVHLDDLGRSVGKTFPIPEDCVAAALAVGVDLGRHRFGDVAMIRSLFRDTGSSVLPVL